MALIAAGLRHYKPIDSEHLLGGGVPAVRLRVAAGVVAYSRGPETDSRLEKAPGLGGAFGLKAMLAVRGWHRKREREAPKERLRCHPVEIQRLLGGTLLLGLREEIFRTELSPTLWQVQLGHIVPFAAWFDEGLAFHARCEGGLYARDMSRYPGVQNGNVEWAVLFGILIEIDDIGCRQV